MLALSLKRNQNAQRLWGGHISRFPRDVGGIISMQPTPRSENLRAMDIHPTSRKKREDMGHPLFLRRRILSGAPYEGGTDRKGPPPTIATV
jgi:hypothetical protein